MVIILELVFLHATDPISLGKVGIKLKVPLRSSSFLSAKQPFAEKNKAQDNLN